jgi:hypothetical protein
MIPLGQSSGIFSKSVIFVNRSSNEFNRVFPTYFRNPFGISSIPQAFPDLRLSRTDLMFSWWILSEMGVSEVIRFWSIF